MRRSSCAQVAPVLEARGALPDHLCDDETSPETSQRWRGPPATVAPVHTVRKSQPCAAGGGAPLGGGVSTRRGGGGGGGGGTAGGAAGGAPRWARGACLSLVYSAASTSVYGGSSVVLLSCTSTRTAEDDRRVGAAPGTWCGVLTAYHFTAYHFTACHLPLTTGLRTSTYHSKSYHAYLLLPVVGLVRLTVYECSHLPVRTYHVLCLLCICAQ